jgi:hypothetical protein
MTDLTITDDMLKGLEDKVVLITGMFNLPCGCKRKPHTSQVDLQGSAARLRSYASTSAQSSSLEILIHPALTLRRATN